MTVYLVTQYGGYDEGDRPVGVYSTLDLARKRATSVGGEVYEVVLDDEDGEATYVPDPPKPRWWDKPEAQQ
jgi:hypothetical protein